MSGRRTRALRPTCRAAMSSCCVPSASSSDWPGSGLVSRSPRRRWRRGSVRRSAPGRYPARRLPSAPRRWRTQRGVNGRGGGSKRRRSGSTRFSATSASTSSAARACSGWRARPRSWRIIPSSGPRRHFGARLSGQPELAALRFAGEQAGVAAVGRFHGFLPRLQKGPSLMSPLPGPQVGGVAAVPGTSIVFDDAFRARLRDLLIWRRDVRRFRRDPLPERHHGSPHRVWHALPPRWD